MVSEIRQVAVAQPHTVPGAAIKTGIGDDPDPVMIAIRGADPKEEAREENRRSLVAPAESETVSNSNVLIDAELVPVESLSKAEQLELAEVMGVPFDELFPPLPDEDSDVRLLTPEEEADFINGSNVSKPRQDEEHPPILNRSDDFNTLEDQKL